MTRSWRTRSAFLTLSLPTSRTSASWSTQKVLGSGCTYEAVNTKVVFENKVEWSPGLDGCPAAHRAGSADSRSRRAFDVPGSG